VTLRPEIDYLLTWYDAHRRRLPWRAPPGRKPEPYHVLLSEVMLQQTTAATVAGRFEGFLARFPTLAALAEAEQADVLHGWQGLGYYRRARALHACAKAVVARHDGLLPRQEDALRALPGIGPYTARAVLAIAFDKPSVPVDANVARVLARLHGIETPMPAALGELQARADALISPDRPGDAAQALMDLGATVCRPRQPRCDACPWQRSCAAHAAGTAEQLPRRATRPARPLRRGLNVASASTCSKSVRMLFT
jgi:A/G-specific adenine glycosylase